MRHCRLRADPPPVSAPFGVTVEPGGPARRAAPSGSSSGETDRVTCAGGNIDEAWTRDARAASRSSASSIASGVVDYSAGELARSASRPIDWTAIDPARRN